MIFLQWNLLQFLGKSKKKKKKKSSDASKETAKLSETTSANSFSEQNTKLESYTETSSNIASSNTSTAVTTTVTDPSKRLKNLRKKLREIEAIEKKISNGEIKAPDKDQKEKVSRKPDVLSEIMALELSLQN